MHTYATRPPYLARPTKEYAPFTILNLAIFVWGSLVVIVSELTLSLILVSLEPESAAKQSVPRPDGSATSAGDERHDD